MHLDKLLIAVVVLLAVTALAVAVFRRIGLGSVLGFLAAGIVVGPAGLQVTDQVEELRHIAELGVVFLLFIIGLEMHPKRLWSMRKAVFGLGSAQVVGTGALIGIYLSAFSAMRWEAALIAGLGLALSSTAFVLQILGERGEFVTSHGQSAFSILLLQDIAIVPLLALVPILAGGGDDGGQPIWERILYVVAAVGGVLVVGRYVFPFLLAQCAKRRNMEAFGMLAMLAVLGAALAMELAHVSMALGAFILGMTLSESVYRFQIEALIDQYKGVLLGLFFISVGMSIDVNVIIDDGVDVLIALGVLVVSKGVILFVLCWGFGETRETAMRVAFLLPQFGEFGFVLFGAAYGAGLIGDYAFSFVLVLISVSMIATPFIVKLGDRIVPLLGGRKRSTEPTEGPTGHLDDHVIIAGYGRVGRIVALMMEKTNTPYVAFERDPERVELGRKDGHNVFYGDVDNAAVYEAAGLKDARAMVVTVTDPHAIARIVSTARTAHPHVSIYARVRDLTQRDSMLAMGVDHAVPEAAEVGIQLGKGVLVGLGMAEDTLRAVLDNFRHDDYAVVRLNVHDT